MAFCCNGLLDIAKLFTLFLRKTCILGVWRDTMSLPNFLKIVCFPDLQHVIYVAWVWKNNHNAFPIDFQSYIKKVKKRKCNNTYWLGTHNSRLLSTNTKSWERWIYLWHQGVATRIYSWPDTPHRATRI